VKHLAIRILIIKYRIRHKYKVWQQNLGTGDVFVCLRGDGGYMLQRCSVVLSNKYKLKTDNLFCYIHVNKALKYHSESFSRALWQLPANISSTKAG
jgi:hypothetical protein